MNVKSCISRFVRTARGLVQYYVFAPLAQRKKSAEITTPRRRKINRPKRSASRSRRLVAVAAGK
jgi:hypothetical protein